MMRFDVFYDCISWHTARSSVVNISHDYGLRGVLAKKPLADRGNATARAVAGSIRANMTRARA